MLLGDFMKKSMLFFMFCLICSLCTVRMYTMEDHMEVDCYANILLQCGIEAGDKQLISKAFDAGANVNLAVIAEGPDYGFTPLMFALRKGDFVTAEKLVARGALVDYRYQDLDGNKKSVASLARDFANPQIVQFLKRHGFDPHKNVVNMLFARQRGMRINSEEIANLTQARREEIRQNELLRAPSRPLRRTRANLHQLTRFNLFGATPSNS